MNLIVKAVVRQANALGINYTKEFLVVNTSPNNHKDDWFKQFGEAWELYHFAGIVESPVT